jgi:hypothetical protein
MNQRLPVVDFIANAAALSKVTSECQWTSARRKSLAFYQANNFARRLPARPRYSVHAHFLVSSAVSQIHGIIYQVM